MPSESEPAPGGRRQRPRHLVLALLVTIVAAYAVSTLPYLGDYPRPDWAEMGIAAPAYKLAHEGVYGNDLFSGFYRSEQRNYEYMPAYPMLVAASFQLFGLGVWQGRLVSICCGLLTILLTYALGRVLRSEAVGVVAAAILVFVRLGVAPLQSGVPLLDLARILRYDILVPVFVLASSIAFCIALDRGRRRAGGADLLLAGAGFLCALAALAHVYGAFLLAVLLMVLLWEQGLGLWRQREVYVLLGGFVVGLLPWLLYVLQDPGAYVGQMSRHEGRFDLFDLRFYWHNLSHEYWRYGRWAEGGLRGLLLRPRVGIWLFLLGVPAAWIQLLVRVRRDRCAQDRFLLLSLPVLALLLGLLLYLKRYNYVVLVLPFIALYIALFLIDLWHRLTQRRWGRPLLAAVLAAAIAEAAIGVRHDLGDAAATTPYRKVCTRLSSLLPTDSTLLISQPYWLGLASYETRSVNLILLLSQDTSIEAALRRVNPDAVVIEAYFLDPDSRDPRRLAPDHRFYPWFQSLREELERGCPQVERIRSFPDYGDLLVFRCHIDDRRAWQRVEP